MNNKHMSNANDSPKKGDIVVEHKKEKTLDDAIEESFPASDSIAVTIEKIPEKKLPEKLPAQLPKKPPMKLMGESSCRTLQ